MYIIIYVYWTIYHLIFVIYVIKTYQVELQQNVLSSDFRSWLLNGCYISFKIS